MRSMNVATRASKPGSTAADIIRRGAEKRETTPCVACLPVALSGDDPAVQPSAPAGTDSMSADYPEAERAAIVNCGDGWRKSEPPTCLDIGRKSVQRELARDASGVAPALTGQSFASGGVDGDTLASSAELVDRPEPQRMMSRTELVGLKSEE